MIQFLKTLFAVTLAAAMYVAMPCAAQQPPAPQLRKATL